MHLLSAKTKSSDLVEDLVGGLRPREGLALRVVCLDEDVIATLRAHEGEVKGLGIRRAALFGSVARGENRDHSDLDLVVAFEEPPRHSLVDVARVQRTLSALLGTNVDLAVEPLQTDRFRAHVEQDLVRAF